MKPVLSTQQFFLRKSDIKYSEFQNLIQFQGSIPGGGWEFFSLPSRPERLWDPPNFLFSGY